MIMIKHLTPLQSIKIQPAFIGVDVKYKNGLAGNAQIICNKLNISPMLQDFLNTFDAADQKRITNKIKRAINKV